MTNYLPGDGFPPIDPTPPHHPWNLGPFAEMQRQTNVNNAINIHYESGKRLAKNYLNFVDQQNLNTVRFQLSNSIILPLRQSLEIATPAPIESLPVQAQNFIKTVALALGVPVEMVATCLLGAIFIAARGNFKIRIDDQWCEVLTAFLILGAQSGDRKSAVVDLMRPVFEAVEAERRMKFDRSGNFSDQQVLLQVLRRMERNLARRVQELIDTTGCSVEMAQSELQAKFAATEQMRRSLQKPKAPPRLLLDTPTLEALAIELVRQDEAIGIFEPEGGFWKHRLNPSTDDILLKAYTGEPFSSDTKTLGSVALRSPVLAACCLVQPAVLEALYENAELAGHGATPRMLPVFLASRRAEQMSVSTNIPPDLLDWYSGLVRRLLSIRRPIPVSTENERTFHVLSLNSEARACIGRYGRDINWRIRNGLFQNYPAFGAKLAGHAARLAGAIHLMTHIEPQSEEINYQSMHAGIEWAEFFRVHAEAAFTPEARDGIACALKIYKWMNRHRPCTFTEREAQRGIGRHSIAQIRAGIDELERCNHLRRCITGVGAISVVHPQAYGYFI
jgi:hypothetical protein